MEKKKFKFYGFSPDLKRKIAAFASVFLVLFAAFFLFFGNKKKSDLVGSNALYYELVKDYMQSEYTEAFADYFDVLYVEELADYNEMLGRDGGNLEATFLMKTYYRYPYRDPDTVQKVIEARENGDMEEYKRLYDEYNQMHKAEYLLKIKAEIENGNTLKDVRLFTGQENGGWVPLENGLKDYIIED